ncbi:SWIRM domain-containing protein [Metarhizium album ARSEF 1941]|uniref:SWIRM domain-containing protein n=1 Tax=Metarhizium album (strain ARSEF 1941) TaxID=1081103 RepID=A0A0B2WLS7_METAS|nr:SWIRM domain-containing protein [Metarhizium album ARSEF 1941]KHN94437.1 SWIRM domain-containing protein [Metarhizium album ARSEF 1941]
MAPPPPPMDCKKFDIISLMSPPDAVLDSFHHGSSALNKSGGANGKQSSSQQPLPMSPPISPYSKPISTTSAAPATPHSQAIKDPVLYPVDEHSPTSPPQPPLFAPAELEHQRIVDEHVRARSQSIFSGVAPPKREDYELVLTFRSQVMKHFTTNRRGWLRKERALLEADRRAGAQRYYTIMPAKPIAAKPPRSQRTDRVSKPHAAPRPIRTNTTMVGTTPARPAGRTSATPEPSRRVVAPNREDKDFHSLPDYCPPLNSLPNRSNCLKVDWKGQPIDLSSDAHAALLHPDELLLAGNLRLDCATYLTSKRRIFERRLQCLRTGKEFRKTDAQQACKIDVNKASKLWTAFEKVGWLDQSWVRPFV